MTQYLPVVPSPIEVFDYVYGILHDPEYCQRYEQYLCRDFPRVPIINDPKSSKTKESFFVSEEMFRIYVAAGEKLRKLHLMQTKVSASLAFDPATPENMEIGSVKYKDGVIELNANTKILGIPKNVWEYQIGGYQVLDKWFKSHKGEALTIHTYSHIENIVGLLIETIKVQESLEMHNKRG